MISVVAVAPRLAAGGLLNAAGLLHLDGFGTSYADSAREVDILQLALRYDADNMAVRRALARTLFMSGQLDQAAGLLKAETYVCRPSDVDPVCWLMWAYMLAQEGRDDEAVRSWRWGADLAVQRWPEEQYALISSSGVHLYRQLVEHDPDRADWRLILMSLLRQIGRIEEAGAEADSLLESGSRSVIEPTAEARAWLVLGGSREKAGDTLGAIEAYEAALARNPQLALAYARLAVLYTSQGQIGRATASARQLAELVPQHPIPVRFQETALGRRLLGYDLVSLTVESCPLLDVVLYWQFKDEQVPSEPGWVRAHDHWLQFIQLPNRAWNAGFELDTWMRSGLPKGYMVPNWMYVADPARSEQRLVQEMRGGRISTVFRQTRSDMAQAGIYLVAAELPRLPVQAGECFLFDADIGGGPGIGSATLWWRDENQVYVAHDNILGLTRDADPAVRCAPARASWMHFVLTLSQGEIEWDNIIIVRLPAMTH